MTGSAGGQHVAGRFGHDAGPQRGERGLHRGGGLGQVVGRGDGGAPARGHQLAEHQRGRQAVRGRVAVHPRRRQEARAGLGVGFAGGGHAGAGGAGQGPGVFRHRDRFFPAGRTHARPRQHEGMPGRSRALSPGRLLRQRHTPAWAARARIGWRFSHHRRYTGQPPGGIPQQVPRSKVAQVPLPSLTAGPASTTLRPAGHARRVRARP
jgi:hypothetical protein